MQPDWEIWLDAHLSPIIAKWLKDKTSWVIKSAFVLKLSSLNDYQIYEKAKAHGKKLQPLPKPLKPTEPEDLVAQLRASLENREK